MKTRAIVALGIGQCVNWGVLYYAYGVLLTPVQQDLGLPAWMLAAAFSLALLVSALLAPIVGRWSDRGDGLALVRGGGYAAAVLLSIWALVPGPYALFLVWAALGPCMAATLYEPVFAVVGRASLAPAARLRALATVTVFGGLASTVFLPLTALLVDGWGWRPAVGLLAITLAASTFVCADLLVGDPAAHVAATTPAVVSEPGDARFVAMVGVFGVASLASTAFTTTLVPALIARDLTAFASALVGSLLGLMQLPGRLLVMGGGLNGSPYRMVMGSLMAQAAGICVIAISDAVWLLAIGVAIFAAGAGLMTLARPYLVVSVFSIDRAGHLNGQLAGVQNIARAGGPVLAMGLASAVGFSVMFGVLATIVAALAVAWVVAFEA